MRKEQSWRKAEMEVKDMSVQLEVGLRWRWLAIPHLPVPYKVGPLPVIIGVITPLSKVITPVNHLQGHL